MKNALSLRSANAIKIGPDYFRIKNLADAVSTWEACRDSNGWGASESPRVTCCIDKKLYTISYNGRVWDAAYRSQLSFA